MSIQSTKSCGVDSTPCRPESPRKDAAEGKRAAFVRAQSDMGESGLDKQASIRRGQTVDPGGKNEATKLDLPVLRQGTESKHVDLCQRSLSALGYQGCKADGKFGPKTAEATRAFQADGGLKSDGVVGNRQTWPAISSALTSRHDGLTRLSDALGQNSSIGGSMRTELSQLNTILIEYNERANVRTGVEARLPTLMAQPSGEMAYINRGNENLADVSRMFGISMAALLASNPDIEKPYLILSGQEIVIPKTIQEELPEHYPHQLHEADPDGHLASSHINPDFKTRINTIIEQLRGEGFDVRVMSGFRTFNEQQMRYDQGRTLSGSVVTDFEAGHSWHNYGLAADIALNDENGNPAWPEASSLFWQRVGDVALAQGAIWGGAFGYPMHIEYHPDYGSLEASRFIDEFESYGLEAVWEQIALGAPL